MKMLKKGGWYALTLLLTLAMVLQPFGTSLTSAYAATTSQKYYIYVEVSGNSKTLDLDTVVNEHGWVTVGYSTAQLESTSGVAVDTYFTSGTNYDNAKAAVGNVTYYYKFLDSNNQPLADISKVDWSGHGAKVANGATDYVPSSQMAWHLDGTINADDYGCVTFNYVDEDGNVIKDPVTVYAIYKGESISIDERGGKTATIEKDGTVYNYKSQSGDIDKDNANVTAVGGVEKDVTFTYSKAVATTYTVKYQWADGTEIADPETYSANVGDVVTVTPKDVAGYTPVDTSKSYTVEENGTVTFTYYKNANGITANSGSFAYDGQEHSVSGFTGAPEGSDFSNISAYGSQTEIGTSNVTFTDENGKAVTGNVVDKTGKYLATTLATGTVSVYDGSFNVAIDGPSSIDYTGTEQKQGVVVTKDGKTLTEGTDYELTYKRNGKETTDFSNAGTVTVTVTGKGAYAGSVDASYVINPIHMKVTTYGAQKVYDGTPLTQPSTLIDGVAEADKDKVKATTTTKVTDVTTDDGVDNHYTLDWGGVAGNYIQDAPTYGKLVVTGQSIDEADDTGKGTDDPDNPYKGITVNDPYDVTYDGSSHKYVPQVKKSDGTSLEAGVDYTVTYKRNGEETTDFTHAGTITIEITGTGNYSGTVTKTYTIDPKDVTITEVGGEKYYDGTELTGEAYVDGIEGGETYTITSTGSQTEVGSSESTYELTWDGTALESDYNIKTVNKAELVVKGQSIDEADDTGKGADDPDNPYKGISISGPEDVTYDGTEHKQPIIVKDAAGNVLEEGVDYRLTYTGDLTNAGSVKVAIEGMGNYSGTVYKEYVINKRTLVVTSGSASKKYDGTALTEHSATITGEGFADGEGAEVYYSGTQTEVGTSKNTVTLKWADGTNADNYDVTYVEGDLTVNEADGTPAKEDDGKKGFFPQTGDLKSWAGYVAIVAVAVVAFGVALRLMRRLF